MEKHCVTFLGATMTDQNNNSSNSGLVNQFHWTYLYEHGPSDTEKSCSSMGDNLSKAMS